jgi:hypothetical protein
MAIAHHRGLLRPLGAQPKAPAARRRSRLSAVFVVLTSLGLAGFGLAEWVLPGGTEPVAYRTWRGPEAGVVSRDTQVATTNAEWHALWSSLRRDPAPAFDASRQTGVAILLGQRPTPGYHVGILGTEQRGDRVIVVIEETRPHGGSLPHKITSPYAILLIDQSGAPVSVEQRVRD